MITKEYGPTMGKNMRLKAIKMMQVNLTGFTGGLTVKEKDIILTAGLTKMETISKLTNGKMETDVLTNFIN